MKLVLLQLFVLCFLFQLVCFMVSSSLECLISQTPSKVAYTITVSQLGAANFTTITNAINFIPSGNNQWVKILIMPGIYKEKVNIPRDKGCIFLEGSDRTTTTITSDAHSTTMESVTFSVSNDNFIAKGITFKNSFDVRSKDITDNVLPAVALMSYGDKHAYYSCGFVGYQDTLWDDKGRHYFHSCYIQGAADFIWGSGQSVYEECSINVSGDGFITAQARESASQTSGYVFRECHVLGTGHAYLGRAYRAFSRVIFIASNFNDLINPEGWHIWDQYGHEKDVTYAEVDCRGPGSDTSKRVPWEKKLNRSQVQQYSTKSFIDQDGWIAKQPL